MNKKFLIIISLLAGIFTSCTMNLPPQGVLSDEDAIQTYNDVFKYRNGFYAGMRGWTSSGFFSSVELQADMFNGIVINGNRGGTIANGTILPSDNDIYSYWASLYGRIGSINYFLEKAEPVYKQAVADGDTHSKDIALYIAEAHFFRGYYYACLFDRFCQQYTADKGDTPALGLPIVTVFAPSADRATYPGRETMNKTLTFINAELDSAYKGLENYEAKVSTENVVPMASYLNTNVVTAMKARIALWTGKYEEAYNLAMKLVKPKQEEGIYTLTARSTYTNMWTKDTSKEIIFEPFTSLQELAGAYGGTWISTVQEQADYIPASNVIAAYAAYGMEKDAFGRVKGYNDCRGNAFLSTRDLKVNAVYVTSPIFYKYPGNPELQSGNLNLVNKPKPFRLSEMYFIAMEAACETNRYAEAQSLFDEYMKARINKYEPVAYSNDKLKAEIRRQRGLELIGEGFRLSDLRRWKQGFNRESGSHYENYEVDGILTSAGLTVKYSEEDHRYTWPIPTEEMQSNPQLAGQQNPGY